MAKVVQGCRARSRRCSGASTCSQVVSSVCKAATRSLLVRTCSPGSPARSNLSRIARLPVRNSWVLMRARAGMVIATRTPATVAWTPDLRKASHRPTPNRV